MHIYCKFNAQFGWVYTVKSTVHNNRAINDPNHQIDIILPYSKEKKGYLNQRIIHFERFETYLHCKPIQCRYVSCRYVLDEVSLTRTLYRVK